MNFMHGNRREQWMRVAAIVLFIFRLAGCNRDETKVYHVPKEAAPPPQPEPAVTPEAAQPEMSPPSEATTSLPTLNYLLPEGWQEKPPSEMRVASFTAPGP